MKLNPDSRCAMPQACRKRDPRGTLCRMCHLKSADFSALVGRLTAEQKKAIAQQIKSTRTDYYNIALDWLICASTVRKIAREFGVMRSSTQGQRRVRGTPAPQAGGE